MAGSIAVRPEAGVASRSTIATLAVCFITVMFSMFAFVVPSPIQGVIQLSLHTSGTQLSWVTDAFILPTVALELTFGVLGDLFGRKRLLVIGSFLMAAGTGLSALTHSIAPLIVGQAISGIGAAAVFPTSLAIIVAVTPDAKSRARGLIVWTMGIALGASVGPLVGGELGAGGDYLPAFAFVAVATAVAGLLAAFGGADSRAEQGRRLDWAGQATIVVALVALLYAIIQAPNNGWTSAATLGFLALGAVFLVAFAVVELKSSEPLLDLRLFRIPAFTGAALVAMIALCGFTGMVYSMSIRMAVIQGESSLRVGLFSLLINLLPFALSPVLPRVLYRFDVRVVLGAGLLCLAAGQFWLSQIPISDTGLGTVTLALMPCGFGFVLIVSSVSGAAVNSVELRQAGMASGATNMVRDLGQALGIAVVGAIALSAAAANLPAQLAKSGLPPQAIAAVTAVAKAAGPFAVAHANLGPQITPHSIPAAQAALWHGYSEAVVITGILSLVAFVITIALVRQPPLARGADQDPDMTPAEA
jgi:MFS family permease